MTRENFYLLLELDPSERDPRRIEAAILKKQADWSRDRNHPTKGRQAQKFGELLQDIRGVMLDAARREEEAREADRLLRERQKEAARQLDEAIGILAAAGHMLESQVTD